MMMKKSILGIFTLVVLSSCVAREQIVEKQVYTCTVNPKVSLKINDELTYIGNFGENKSVAAPDASHPQRTEAYLFAKSDTSNSIEKALVITSQKILQEDVYYQLKCSWFNEKHTFVNEYTKFLNHRSCRVVSAAGPNFFQTLGVDLSDSKVDKVTGSYYLEFHEIIVGGQQIHYNVAYLQKIKNPIYFSSFSNGLSVEELNPKQKKEYEQFLENSKNIFKTL
ncbi:MAG: hypothetical protein GY710_23780 [Desulfobacteraceae bacterium]|nr:hypothetical protein [Desulfobacteraceae bacterium]